MSTSDCYCDAYGTRCTLHDEMNYIISEADSEPVLDRRGMEIKLLSKKEIIELLVEEDSLNV